MNCTKQNRVHVGPVMTGEKKCGLNKVLFLKPSLEKVMTYYRFIAHCTISPLFKIRYLISLPPLNFRSSFGIGNINSKDDTS